MTCKLFSIAIVLLAARATAAERVALVTIPDGQPMAAKTDAKGNIHLLYDSADGPQYVRSADNAKTFSPPVAVIDHASRKPGLEFAVMDMAVAPDGRVHVAMMTNAWKLKLPNKPVGFQYTQLKPGATEFAPVRSINQRPSEGFSLAANAQGNVTACWLAGKLYANISHDSGETFGPTIEIDQELDPCNCCTTSCTYADGKLAILYREETNDDRDMYLILWDQERGRTTRSRVGSNPWKTDSCPMTYFSVVATRQGFLATWPTRGDVYFARLNTDGAPLSAAETKTPGSTNTRTNVLALDDAAGKALVAWKKDGRMGWQVYDKRGQPQGHAGSAASAGTGAAGVVTQDGHFILFP
jgi:hypothetical protein